jgi:hypothetical protein
MKTLILLTGVLVALLAISASAIAENQMLIRCPILVNPDRYKLTRDVADELYSEAMFRNPIRATMTYIWQQDICYTEVLFILDFMYDRFLYLDYIYPGTIFSYGEFGGGSGPEMNSPTSIDVFTQQDEVDWSYYYYLFIADWGNSRIKRLAYDWWNLTYSDIGPITDAHIVRPIDLDIGNNCQHDQGPLIGDIDAFVWVLNSNCTISKFGFSGTHYATYGSCGSGTGQFSEPMAIACGRAVLPDGSGCEYFANDWDVYVADNGNSRVVRLNTKPYQWLGEWTLPGEGGLTITDLEVDPCGNVWATWHDGGISKWTKYLDFLGTFGTQGFGPNQFFRPKCIANSGGYLGCGGMCITESWRDSSGVQYYVIGTDIEEISIVQYSGSPQCNANITFKLLDHSYVGVRIYNQSGALVRTVRKGGIMAPGIQSVWWDGKNYAAQSVPNGNYRVQIADTSSYVWISGGPEGEPANIVTKSEWFYFCDLGFCSTGDGATHPPGDCSKSDMIDIDDIVCAINYVFSGGPTWCPPYSVDADISGVADVDDIVYLINYVFSGGPAPMSCSEWVTQHGVPACE